MKKLLLVVFTVALLTGCENDPNSEVIKKLVLDIEANGMGMLKGVEVQSIEKINDSTFRSVHTFINPMTEKETRITRINYFDTGITTIKEKESEKGEMMVEGEWIKAY